MAGRMPGTLFSKPVHFLDLALISQGLAVLLSLRKCDNEIATRAPNLLRLFEDIYRPSPTRRFLWYLLVPPKPLDRFKGFIC